MAIDTRGGVASLRGFMKIMARRGSNAPAALAACLAVLAAPRAARAADPSVADCVTANESSIKLRGDHKLRDARTQLLVCVAASCPAEIRDACSRRMGEVTEAMPSVVFDAKDPADNDLTAVTVTMDGKPLLAKLEGVAVPLDPGEHKFGFDAAGYPHIDKTVVVQEAQKGRHVAINFGVAAGAGAAAAAGPAPSGSPAPSPEPAPVAAPPPVAGPPPAAGATPPAPAVGTAPAGGDAAQPAATPAPAAPAQATREHNFHIGVRLAFAVPLGTFTGGDSPTPLSDWFAGGLPLGLDVGYMVIPRLYVGGYVTYTPLFDKAGGNGCPSGVTCSDHGVELGAQAQFHILPGAPVDPWFGGGFGYEWEVGSQQESGVTVGTTDRGFEYLKLQGGVDFKTNEYVSVGPYLDLAIGSYSNFDESCSTTSGNSSDCSGFGGSSSISQTSLHEWLSIGVRGTLGI